MKSEELDPPELAKRWIEEVAEGVGLELEVLTLQGLKVQLAHKGLLRCNFLIPDRLSDKDGNWHVGAMATLIDNIGAVVAVSSFGKIVKASVDSNFSFYSTPKIHDEVEIEGKVVAKRGKLVSVVVEVKNKRSGELIALGRQWLTLFNTTPLVPKPTTPSNL
ncbi:hypothetical protein LguiA_028685 [Lonicera macranthoides]